MMAKTKKYNYGGDQVILDIKNNPDAITMIQLAKSMRGIEIKDMQNGKIALIQCNKSQSVLRSKFRAALTCLVSRRGEMTVPSMEKEKMEEEISRLRHYNAMILK